jgi:hypothetical protein
MQREYYETGELKSEVFIITPTEKKNETKNILLNTFSVMQMYLKRLDST